MIVYRAVVRHDGCQYELDVPNLRLPICRQCGEKIFCENADRQIRDALRAKPIYQKPAMHKRRTNRAIRAVVGPSASTGKKNIAQPVAHIAKAR